MTFENIHLEISDKIGIITIQREKQLNALNRATLTEIAEVLQILKKDSEVRALLFTGAGEKAFVAGADIKEFADFNAEQGEALAQKGQKEVFDVIAHFPKPVLAAINGYALGGGLELAMAAHLRIASNTAKMGLPEVTLGLIPGYGGTQRLTQLVGKAKAIEWICSAEMIDADTAFQHGLVNHVCAPENLIQTAKNLLSKFTNKAPLAVEKALTCVQEFENGNGYETEIQSFGALFSTADFKEGTRAFMEKRKPNFSGN